MKAKDLIEGFKTMGIEVIHHDKPITKFPHPLSEKIRKRRVYFKIKQQDVANATGLSLKVINNIEKDCSNVGFENVLKYLDFFEMDLREIIYDKMDSLIKNQEIKQRRVRS